MRDNSRSLIKVIVTLLVLAWNSHLFGSEALNLDRNNWANGRPASITIISGVMKENIPLWGAPLIGGITWVDKDNGKPMAQLEKLCAMNVGSSYKCGEVHPRDHHRIEEVYIGAPEGLKLPGGKKTKLIAPLSVSDLQEIPPNVKRVILINIWGLGWLRQALTAVFDEGVSDDDLRALVLEDGIYRVYGWRKD